MVLGWGMAQADVVSFVINPATSFVQFDLDSEQATFVEQTPGSLQTTFSGTINIDVDDPMNPGSIQVVGASAQADDNGSSEPGPAPANAAGEWATFYSTPRDVAFRNIVVDIQGPAQALSGGQFDASQLSLAMTAGQMDYSGTTIFGVLALPGGSSSLSGSTAQNGSSQGSVTTAGSDLVFAMNLTFQFIGDMNGVATPYQLTATVEAVAQNAAAVPEPTTGVLFLAGVLGLVMNRLRYGARISRDSST